MPPVDSIPQVPAVGGQADSGAPQVLASRTRPAQPPPEAAAKPAKPAANMMREVTLRYQVDAETQAVSLLIIDRQSRKVIRTVPSEELARLGVNRIFESLA